MISCKAITKSYTKGANTVTPLENLTLEVPRGEFLALMGPSGSGKTTLLNLISGIDTPTSGSLEIDGEDIARFSRKQLTQWRARKVGYIFQLYHLIPVLTAFENVELPLLITSLSRCRAEEESGGSLGNRRPLRQIPPHARRAFRRPGTTRRHRPCPRRRSCALLVADEPTGDLDRESATHILGLLGSLAREHGKTIVMVTHDARAAAAADRTLHLEKGKLLTADPNLTTA